MNRRSFFTQLASGLVVASAPSIWVPKLIKPKWKLTKDIVYVQPLASVELNSEIYHMDFIWCPPEGSQDGQGIWTCSAPKMAVG